MARCWPQPKRFAAEFKSSLWGEGAHSERRLPNEVRGFYFLCMFAIQHHQNLVPESEEAVGFRKQIACCSKTWLVEPDPMTYGCASSLDFKAFRRDYSMN